MGNDTVEIGRLPRVITTYLAAQRAHDAEAAVACCTEDAVVVDEGRTYRGPREIADFVTGAAPEHTVVVSTDTSSAREVGRAFVADPYLRRSNYVANLLRHGYDESDVAGGASDRLIDDLVPHGTPEALAGRLAGHLDAGADHVAVQVLPLPGQDPLPGLRALAAELTV